MKEKIAQRLFVFMPPRRALPASGKAQPTASTVVGYVAVDSTGSMQPGETPIALLPKASRVDVVFDTADVFVAAIDVPRLSEARLRLALPNILEERLLADASDGHFAFTPPGRSSGATTVATAPKLPVAVIDRGLLTRTLDALAESGYRPRAAYNEIYTVPAPAAGVLSVRVASPSSSRATRRRRHCCSRFASSASNTLPPMDAGPRSLPRSRRN